MNLPRFDVAVAYDSLQSLGFGRFSDGLQPWADQIMMARIWCLTVPDKGQMLVAFPDGKDKDRIDFNFAR